MHIDERGSHEMRTVFASMSSKHVSVQGDIDQGDGDPRILVNPYTYSEQDSPSA
jgi:hypothetical protein